jgi:selenocysteine lyase/cysteine desulfurase/tRNA(Ile)-lysidine synthase TilS/MesJ
MSIDEELEFGQSLAESEAFSLGEEEESQHHQNKQQWSKSTEAVFLSQLRESICSDMIGDKTTYQSPFILNNSNNNNKGSFLSVPLIYCDHTATNRTLQSMESFITTECLPLLGNTHTTTSTTGCQSTSYVAEARQIIAEYVNAKVTGNAATDVVLFTGGTGVTSAVQLLIDILDLTKYKYNSSRNKTNTKPVVFVGPYEHHSNLIPWRECGCEIVPVPIHPVHGGIHLEKLEYLLTHPRYGYNNKNNISSTATRLRIGTFSIASNVTGRISDTQAITTLLHKYHALSFWDYATGASYLPIDMNPTSFTAAIDAVFLSPHKILGGSGGSIGILIVKKYLVSPTQPPTKSGGGTVFYVTNQHHLFLSNPVDRYEGGSPNIPGIIRTGLTFLYKRYTLQQLKRVQKTGNTDTGTTTFPLDFFSTWKYVVDRLSKTSPNLIILGSSPYLNNKICNNNNLPIFSFLIQCGSRFLHHNFVCALLNDMFGIQTRGGCQCAGPYSQYLIGLTTDTSEFPNESNQRIEEALLRENIELLRVGFTRLSLPYLYMRDIEIEYVMMALEFVAKHGWKFLYQYRCNDRTGEWRHHTRQGMPLGSDRKWLHKYIPPFLHHQSSNKNNIIPEEKEECCKSIRPLERVHKCWLSSYFPPFLPLNNNNNDYSADDENSSAAWKNLLDQTLENANLLLQQLQLDTTSIVQVMNATTNDVDILPHYVQDLRWYIYPRECARMLYDGIGPTSSFQQPKILGAIQPLERKTPPTKTDEESQQATSDSSFEIPPLLPTAPDGLPGAPWITGSTSYPTKKNSTDSSLWGRPRDTGVCVVDGYQKAGQQCKSASLHDGGQRKPPAKMMRLVMKAVFQWNMIEDGDRLLLGLSGGKDSLSLLHCLLELQRKLPIPFSVQVCTIDPMTPSFDPSPLIPYVRDSLGLQYHYIRTDIVTRAASCGKDGQAVSSFSAFCSRMRRGHLYQCAREHGCNKLVLAQHLDDMAESFLMSVMHNGFVRTMKANYQINAGDLAVIRPLAYCRESLTAEFAKSAGLPVINEKCFACFEEAKERARVKKLLLREGMLYP